MSWFGALTLPSTFIPPPEISGPPGPTRKHASPEQPTHSLISVPKLPAPYDSVKGETVALFGEQKSYKLQFYHPRPHPTAPIESLSWFSPLCVFAHPR